MLSRKTRHGALLLMLTMLVWLLSACGGAAAVPEETTAASEAEPAATEIIEEPTAEPEPEPMEEATATTEMMAEPTEATEAEGEMAEGMLPEVDPAAVEGDIIAAGSSTVYPLAVAIADRFQDEGYAGQITIDEIGSGAGFERFCVNAETDISNASRPINEEEIAACEANGRTPIEFRVGTDALAVVVSPENPIEELSLAQLAQIFSGEVTNWSELGVDFDEPIQTYSPGTDSGTFDYFVEAIFDEDQEPILANTATQFSEDDNVLVQGVAGSPGGIGYFGYAYYVENADDLKILTIEGVEPNDATAESGEYPLSRPLFIYSDAGVMEEKPQVADFIAYFLSTVNEEISDVGYFPASQEALDQAMQSWLDAQP